MPSAEWIVAAAAGIATRWLVLAVVWHVYLAGILVALSRHAPRSSRVLATLLIAPVVSVSGLAWFSGNPFNGAVFAALALLMSGLARRLTPARPVVSSTPSLVSGAALVAYAWTYPHFLAPMPWTTYLVAAPFGLLPCPTLAAVIGITLMVRTLQQRAWSLTVGAAGLIYGLIGIVSLGVTLDMGLLAGAVALIIGTILQPAAGTGHRAPAAQFSH